MLSPSEINNPYRIAILGIYHESNTFVPEHTTIHDFKNSRWLKGDAIIKEYEHAHHEIGGAIEVFEKSGARLLPVFYTETTPGGMIEKTAFDELVTNLVESLNAVLPVDALFVVPHGAAVAENHADMDGEWLALLREKVGENIPIVGTLDPHANLSQQMVDNTQGLFPYSTNPHIDQRETGSKAARFLLDILDKKINPVQTLFQAPLIISIEQQETAADPCKSLYQFASELGHKPGVMHVNITLGFPYADVAEMGTAAIIITEGNNQANTLVKDELYSYFTENKKAFSSRKEDIKMIIHKLTESARPVLLLDMGDNVGGGSMGDSTYLLEQLDSTGLKTFVAIYAPDAVAICMQHPLNTYFQLSFGKNPETGNMYNTKARTVSFHSGVFVEEKPRHGGQRNYDMGSTAVVITEKGQTVMLHSKRIPPFSLAQLTSCEIDPGMFDVVIAKGVVAPIAAYSSICKSIIRVNSPGVTQACITQFNYKNRRRPLYPFEK